MSAQKLTCPRCHEPGFNSKTSLERHLCNGINRESVGRRLELRKLTLDEVGEAIRQMEGALFPPELKPDQLGLL